MCRNESATYKKESLIKSRAYSSIFCRIHFFLTDSCKCHGGLVENVESAGTKNESANKKMNPSYVFMNPPPYIMNPSENVRRSHIFSAAFVFNDAGFIYATWRTRLKK